MGLCGFLSFGTLRFLGSYVYFRRQVREVFRRDFFEQGSSPSASGTPATQTHALRRPRGLPSSAVALILFPRVRSYRVCSAASSSDSPARPSASSDLPRIPARTAFVCGRLLPVAPSRPLRARHLPVAVLAEPTRPHRAPSRPGRELRPAGRSPPFPLRPARHSRCVSFLISVASAYPLLRNGKICYVSQPRPAGLM